VVARLNAGTHCEISEICEISLFKPETRGLRVMGQRNKSFEMRQCSECDRWFHEDETSSRVCTTWLDEREQRHPIGEAYEKGWYDGYVVGQRKPGVASRPAQAFAEPGLLRDLIRLCHPDMHPPERAALATRLTQTLNGLREAS
jgi:hypothetical protein